MERRGEMDRTVTLAACLRPLHQWMSGSTVGFKRKCGIRDPEIQGDIRDREGKPQEIREQATRGE